MPEKEPQFEGEKPMKDERFREIYHLLKNNDISDKEIGAFAQKQNKGGLEAMTKKAKQKEVGEFMEDLEKRVHEIADEELEKYSKKYFPGQDQGRAIMPGDFFMRELVKRIREKLRKEDEERDELIKKEVKKDVGEMTDEELEGYSKKYFSDYSDTGGHIKDIFRGEISRREEIKKLKSEIPEDETPVEKTIIHQSREESKIKKWWQFWE